MPIQHALQGHPEAGLLWEKYINSILRDPTLNFKSTRHEPNIYHARIDGVSVLSCRQVDDFALETPNPAIATKVFLRIGELLKLPGESYVPFLEEGIVEKFNGVDVQQTRHYTKISCESYL